MSKTYSLKIVDARNGASLFVPTLLSLALLSAFPSSALAVNGDSSTVFKDIWGYSTYGNTESLTNNKLKIEEALAEGVENVYGAYTEKNNQEVFGNEVFVSVPVNGAVVGGIIVNDIEGVDSVSSKANDNFAYVESKTEKPAVASVSGGEVWVNFNVDRSVYTEANHNTVSVSSFTVNEDVFGGYSGSLYKEISEDITKSNNPVTISANANYNDVTISSSTILNPDDNDNDETVSSSTTLNDYTRGVYGGYVNAYTFTNENAVVNVYAIENTVTVSGSIIDEVYGGAATTFDDWYYDEHKKYVYGYGNVTAQANWNKVNITSDETTVNTVEGGYSDAGSMNGAALAEANFNEVALSKVTVNVNGNMYGGASYAESYSTAASYANDNTVTIYQTTLNGNGGYVDGSSAIASGISTAEAYANDNTVEISSSELTSFSVYGSYSSADTLKGPALAEANGNSVSISQSLMTGSVYGGNADAVYGNTLKSYANNNTVDISGDTSSVSGIVFGGLSEANHEYGAADSAFAEANYNSVSISQAKLNKIAQDESSQDEQGRSGYAVGGYAFAEGDSRAFAYANHNTVEILNNATIADSIYGAYSEVQTDKGQALTEANYNTVRISKGTVGCVVHGGYAYFETYTESAAVNAYSNENNVIVSDAVITDNVFGGSVYTENNHGSFSAQSNANTVSVSQSTLNNYLYGGRISNISGNGKAFAEANNNSVTVQSTSKISGRVYGSRIDVDIAGDGEVFAEANNNTLKVSSSKISNNVYGSFVEAYESSDVGAVINANAKENTVVVADGSKVTGNVYGGYARTYYYDDDDKDEEEILYGYGNVSTQAHKNTVSISGQATAVSGVIISGYSVTGTKNGTALSEAMGNNLTLSETTVTNEVLGAYAYAVSDSAASAYANNNAVTILNSKVGDADPDSVDDNVNNGNDSVYGGLAGAYVDDEGSLNVAANNNTVTISSSEVLSDIHAGYVYAYSESSNGSTNVKAYANENSVFISGNTTVDLDVNGGFADTYDYENGAGYGNVTTQANRNTVSISDSSIEGRVSGGCSFATGVENAFAEANYNTITISHSKVNQSVYGGYAEAEYGIAVAHADNNTVVISDSAQIGGNIYGALTDAYYGDSHIEQANNNTVIIDSATVTGKFIVGGAVWIDESDSYTAENNTVSISGDYMVEGVSLYGGYDNAIWHDSNGTTYKLNSANENLFTGNTLNVDARVKNNTTTAVGQVANFETINLRAGEINPGVVILSTDSTILGDGNSKGTAVNLVSVETDSLKAKDQITLIANATGNLANDGQKHFTLIGESLGVGYNGIVNLVEDGASNNVVLEIEGKGANPKAKVLNESRAAQMAFLNAASDILQDQDIHQAGKHVFGAVRGIYNTYKTGSSVDISGVGLVTGVANTWVGDSADLTGAVFVEAGWGSFDTKNSILGGVQRGDGDSYYYGTGLIGKYDVTQGLLSGLYAEAAAHVGIISTDYSNAGLANANGLTASYDSDSLYYAAHATAGYRWDVTDSLDVDVSATYLWNYLEGEKVKIHQDKFKFDSVQSHRVRVAAEVGYTADKGFRPYAGVAWEREFDGKAGGSVAGYRLDEADLGGNSGLAWAGVSFEPKEGGPIKADAEITTYFGQRKGVSGRVWLRYEF